MDATTTGSEPQGAPTEFTAETRPDDLVDGIAEVLAAGLLVQNAFVTNDGQAYMGSAGTVDPRALAGFVSAYIRERFTAHTEMTREQALRVAYPDGPECMLTTWWEIAAARRHPNLPLTEVHRYVTQWVDDG